MFTFLIWEIYNSVMFGYDPNIIWLLVVFKKFNKIRSREENWTAQIHKKSGKKITSYMLFYNKWTKSCKLLRMHNEFYTSYVKWISMSNSARGTGEPLLIGSEASCIIMGRASLLSHCGSSRITRRKERERQRAWDGRGRERKNKGHGSWPGRVGGIYESVCVGKRMGGGVYEGPVLHSSSSGQRQTHDCPSPATQTHTEARASFTGVLLHKQRTEEGFVLLFQFVVS